MSDDTEAGLPDTCPVPFLLGQDVRVALDIPFEPEFDEMAEAGTVPAAAHEAVARFTARAADLRQSLEPRLYAYARDEEGKGIAPGATPLREASEVWSQVGTARSLMLIPETPEGPWYAVLTCDVAWEPEHQLQMSFKDGDELTRVGPGDIHHAHPADADGRVPIFVGADPAWTAYAD